MEARREEVPGISKVGIKKKTRQEHGALKWDWLEGLYLSQEKTKLNHTLLSFEAANPQIHSCRLFS